MQLTIDIKDSALDKIMYLLESLKKDVKIVEKDSINSLDIELIKTDDREYKYILEGRQERKRHPENYETLESIQWDK